MNKKNPADYDYLVGPDATIEDINLDEEVVFHEGERLTEARAAEIAEESARLAREANEAPVVPGPRVATAPGDAGRAAEPR
jgi:hypothetical protein